MVDKKKLKGYILVLCIAVLASVWIPGLIDQASQSLVEDMLEETEDGTEGEAGQGRGISGRVPSKETEKKPSEDRTDTKETDAKNTDAEKTRGTDGGSSGPEAKQGNGNETELTPEKVQKKKQDLDEAMKEYRESFHPEITEAYSGVKETFIGKHTGAFNQAVADYFFQAYGDLYQVTGIEIKEMLDETDDEIRCMAVIRTKSGSRTYSQDYLIVYNKPLKFYSVYAYNR